VIRNPSQQICACVRGRNRSSASEVHDGYVCDLNSRLANSQVEHFDASPGSNFPHPPIDVTTISFEERAPSGVRIALLYIIIETY
jgi:hypothetical protein